jgi:hypothetical protein
MRVGTLSLLAAAAAAVSFLVPAADAAPPARPPLVWLKGEGNFTKSHRPPRAIRKIVVHVTEGSFWGSVSWLKNPRAHASSHFVVARSGRIIQLVHLSDVAWHAGNWKVNAESVGIEHEGFTYGSGGFTTAQYRASARLAAWIATRSLLPIDRAHLIGHAQVPAPDGGRGGSGHHTDPGPHWNWNRYLRLVRSYARSGGGALSVTPLVPPGPLRGVVPWRARTSGGIHRVEFSIDGRVVSVDRRAPFRHVLNTTRIANGPHVLQLHGIAGPGRYDIARRTVVVANKAFALTSAGARPWTRVRGHVRLRVRPWGAKAASMTFRVDGRRRLVDRRPPFLFVWNARGAKPGKHVLEVVATSVDGRLARKRLPLVVGAAPKPKPALKPPVVQLRILGQSLAEGQEVSGLVVWRVDTAGKPEQVEFRIDGEVRGEDVQRPFTLGWDTATATPGEHVLEARAVGAEGREARASLRVVVAAPPS